MLTLRDDRRGPLVAMSALIAVCGYGLGTASEAQPRTESRASLLVASPASLLARCRATARTVGYAVPCPTRIPEGSVETGSPAPKRCSLHIIGPAGLGACSSAWRGWVIGSSSSGVGHLVITASPHPLGNDAKLVNGPAWSPETRVRLLRRERIGRRHVRVVLVPASTNEGSAFADHVVLIWTAEGHTYGVGFHNVRGLGNALAADEELAKGVKLVFP